MYLFIFFILIMLFLSYGLIFYLFISLNSLKKKYVNINHKDISAFIDQMREVVIEGRRISDDIDYQIKEKEGILEDISSLIDSKLGILKSLDSKSYTVSSDASSSDRKVYNSELVSDMYHGDILYDEYLEKIEAHEKLYQDKINKQEAYIRELTLELSDERSKNRGTLEIEFANKERMLKERLAQEEAIRDKLLEELELREDTLRAMIHGDYGSYDKTMSKYSEKKKESSNDSSTLVYNSRLKSSNISSKEKAILPDMQAHVYSLLLKGFTEAQIAKELSITIEDVERYLSLNL